MLHFLLLFITIQCTGQLNNTGAVLQVNLTLNIKTSFMATTDFILHSDEAQMMSVPLSHTGMSRVHEKFH